jgi:DnaK suppressor protein
MSNPEYQARLQAMLEEITKELQSVGIHNPENPSDWIAVPEDLDTEEPDENLSADSVESWNERTALVATLEPQYNNIQAALARIEAGTFGMCEICKAPIEEKRLEANPVSRTCVEHMDEIIPSNT